MSSPTQRTLALLRKMGYLAQVVERWNAHAGVRVDLFGFIDIVAIRQGEILGVQCTSTSSMSARLAKSKSLNTLPAWLAAGGKYEVIGWAKRGKANSRKVWTPRRVRVAADSSSSFIETIVETWQ